MTPSEEVSSAERVGRKWQCETCGTVYAEYINGCPHCWEAGIRSGVREVGAIQGCHVIRDEGSVLRLCGPFRAKLHPEKREKP
jgi:hypothetical protein